MLLRAKPRCWVWGLIPLFLVGVLVVIGTKDLIEKDLSTRSTLALKSADIEWATPKFRGLEGTIQGQAPSEKERLKAIQIVRGVWGVRSVTNKLSLSPKITPYTWSALHENETLELGGYVPNAKVRQSVIGVVKAKFPQAKLIDNLKIGRGIDDEKTWFSQVSYGLNQLARLREGQVKLIDDKLSLKGVALDKAGYESLGEIFTAPLPLNLVTQEFSVLPPKVENYQFFVRYDPQSLSLEGVVANKAISTQIEKTAKANFSSLDIQNKLTLGSGAPHAWDKAISLSLKQLSKLNAGTVTIQNQDVRIEGLAKDKEIANQVRIAVRANYPKGYKVTDVITVKEPEIPLASPFELSIFDAQDELLLQGVVENNEQRATILKALRETLPNRRIVDELKIARGASANFLAGIEYGIGLLPQLTHGRLTMRDTTLSLSGETTNSTLHSSLKTKPSSLPTGIDWVNEVRFNDTLQRRRDEQAAAEAKRLADEQAAAEAKRLADEQAAAEAKRLADEQAAAEAKRLADEQAATEAKRLADEKAQNEAKRFAEEKAQKEIINKAELEKRRQWLSFEETNKRLSELHQENGAVNAKECQLLMNSIVRGSAIRFSVNSSVINPSSDEVLANVEKVASRCSNTVIRIEGHTDADGSQAYNLELSKRRARAVIAYLIQKGIPQKRLDAKGYGEKKPIASNATANGKSLNRRIEFVVFED